MAASFPAVAASISLPNIWAGKTCSSARPTHSATGYYNITGHRRTALATYDISMQHHFKGKLTCSPEDSHASHSARPENAKALRMPDTSGLKCSGSSGRSGPNGSLEKTFTAYLVGMTGWYSNRCTLTWKEKATKCRRMYYQLQVSALPTEDTGYGSSGAKKKVPLAERQILPTPTAMDATGATAHMRSSQIKEGSMHSMTLSRWAAMMPTPTASDCNWRQVTENWKGYDLVSQVQQRTGQTGQLNPRFVAEMMGFPIHWTELPFQNGEENQ